MFQETLLIMKNDYLPKRKTLLIKMLGYGFQIQTSRRLLFTPELAAQFYNDNTEECNFMLQVILLSKGPSEAFILTMENAVEELNIAALCYFCTSIEMERHVHVSKTLEDACREIKFIFPNYIFEPINYFDKSRLCHGVDMEATLSEAYDILKNQKDEPEVDWKMKLGEWFLQSNKLLPAITNECSVKPQLGFQEKSAQTRTAALIDMEKRDDISLITSGSTSVGSSGKLSSSSCISCHGFESSARTSDREICKDLILKKTALSEADAELKRTPPPLPKQEEEEVCEVEIEHVILPDEQGSSGEEEAGEEEPSADTEIIMDDDIDFRESVEQNAEPERESVPEPVVETQTAVEPEPQAQPAPEPQAQPEPEPQAQPEPEPQAQPEPEPQAQPEPEPQVQSEPEPQVQPEPEPVTEPPSEPIQGPVPEPPEEAVAPEAGAGDNDE